MLMLMITRGDEKWTDHPKYKASDYRPYKGMSRTPGQTIKALRELHEWSQVELAEMTGISQATISSLETGRTALGAERAKSLLRPLISILE